MLNAYLYRLSVPALAIVLSACSGSGVLTGVFTSSGGVAGLNYSTATQSGVTDSSGTFEYKAGETITFSLGDTIIGEAATAKADMTPFDLVPGAVLYTSYNQLVHVLDRLGKNTPPRIAFNKFNNILTFLQALDEDKNPDNGIYINSGMATLFNDIQIDFAVDWDDFKHGDRDVSMLSVRAHQAVSQGILSNAFIPGWGVALDQYYAMQSISHNLATISTRSYDDDADGNPNYSYTYTYDDRGNRLTETYIDLDDPSNNKIETYTYDANGNRLTKSRDYDATNEPGVNRSWTYTYDTNGNQLTESYIDLDFPIDDNIKTYTYDANGNRLSESRDYDATNNPGINNTRVFTHDINGNTLSMTYTSTDYTDDNSINIYTYDSNGNELTSSNDFNATNDPGINYSKTKTYDANGNELTIAGIDANNTSKDFLYTFTYDANDNVLTFLVDDNATLDPGDNQTDTYTYDANSNKLTHNYIDLDDINSTESQTYSYDENGNLLTQAIDQDSTSDPGVNWSKTHTYDTNGARLTTTYINVDNTNRNYSSTYTYDTNGNELTQTTDIDSTYDPGVNSSRRSTWVSSTWAAVLYYIEDQKRVVFYCAL